jgi:transposase
MRESVAELAGQADLRQAAAGGAGPGRKVYRRLSESLTDDQQRALGLITEGTAIREVGQQLGIHRGTIYRWLKSDPYFRAAYNAWQLEQQESCRAALMKAAEMAVAKVIENFRYNPTLAWQVIKELGILSRPKSLSVDPKHVEMEIAVERHEEETVLLQRIEREMTGDLISPRGDLSRLLRIRHDAETGEASVPPVPGSAQGEPDANAAADVSRE